MKVAIVKSSELGTGCWNPSRFLGSECKILDTCKNSCKKTCKAHTPANYRVLVKRKRYADGRIEEEGSEVIGGKNDNT
jgi:hypothetical protein